MLIFTYGTLMKGYETCEEAKRITAKFEFLGRGIAPGVMYDLMAYPGVTENADNGGMVVGSVYHCPSEMLDELDAYEGAPSLFKRKKVTVRMDRGELIQPWMYYYCGGLRIKSVSVVVSGDWRRVIEKRRAEKQRG